MNVFRKAEFEAAAAAVRARADIRPRIGIVLGSGLGAFAESVEEAIIIPFEDIPNWPGSTVQGHQGKLYIGQLEEQPVLVMRGRIHYYEGYPMDQITLPIRVMQLLGVEIVILTNAAGGIGETLTAGDLMLIVDHINLPGLAGQNPLVGPNDDTLGPRFPDMVQVYDGALQDVARTVAREHNVPLKEGVYAGLSGPSFETPAEIRFLRLIGADAVGMSTVPEATVAHHGGMRVLAFSSITNVAVDQPTSRSTTTHEEVLETGKIIAPRLEIMLRGILTRL